MRVPIIPSGFTAERLVTGEADLAVQQISELKQVAGIEIVGPIPRELQTPAVFSAGLMAASNKRRCRRSGCCDFWLRRRSRRCCGRVRAGALNLPAPSTQPAAHDEAILRVCRGGDARRIAAPALAHAQSADLVLCDRVAADPSDPDKPADVKGVPDIAAADIATAIKYCKIAAKSSRRAMYQLGRAYAANRQMPEAIAAWRKAADKGSTSAMVELGVLYGTGAGVARDEAQARKLFERAAQAGNPRGVSNLAALGGGAGSAADPARARELLVEGCRDQRRGAVSARHDAGGGYRRRQGRHGGARAVREGGGAKSSRRAGADGRVRATGRGGAKDSDAAKAYYERAAALGDEDAKKALERMRCPMTIKDKRGNVVTNLCF